MSGERDACPAAGGARGVRAQHGRGVGALVPCAAADPSPPAPCGAGVELAASAALPAVVDVLRRAFPCGLRSASPDYVEAFVDSMMVAGAQGTTYMTPFDRAFGRACRTALGLAGFYAGAERGQA
jgi:hypothetical protein